MSYEQSCASQPHAQWNKLQRATLFTCNPKETGFAVQKCQSHKVAALGTENFHCLVSRLVHAHSLEGGDALLERLFLPHEVAALPLVAALRSGVRLVRVAALL